ncbi:MAG: hypothetical protein WKF78_01540 [Candidatus Limnocylindrales bacterium]
MSTSLWRYWTLTPSLVQVVGQVLGHLLGERRDEHPLAPFDALADLARSGRRSGPRSGGPSIVGIDDAGRPDELLDDAARLRSQLVRARASRSCTRPG